MAVYPVALSSRTEPMDEPPVGPLECYEGCIHAAACEAQYERCMGWPIPHDGLYWTEKAATLLGCCEECSEGA